MSYYLLYFITFYFATAIHWRSQILKKNYNLSFYVVHCRCALSTMLIF